MNSGTIEAPKFDQFLDCVHCGFCLPACPTFTLLGTEMDSPRGRIHLMRALAEGQVSETDTYRAHIESCLVCRSCETACPSGVQFGAMMESARSQLQIDRPRRMRALGLSVLAHPRILQVMAGLARFAQKSGAAALYDLLFSPKVLSPSFLPPMPPASIRNSYGMEIIPAVGTRRYRVGFLRGCVADVMFSRVNRDTIDVLTRNGCEVIIPREQTCCGALHVHNGMREEARELAKRNIDAFLDDRHGPLDAIITNAAGCGSTLKEYHALLESDDDLAAKAKVFSGMMRDISEFLATIPLVPYSHEIDATVAYHDACHLAHGQKIREAPRTLLRAIPGMTVVDLNDAEMCCGSAGIYNIVQPDIAGQLQERKIAFIRATGARIVAAANPGCVLQIAAGARDAGLDIAVVHPIELIARAYRS